jgi:dTDP-4-amino-4,6-dideoxygalactose transaminase
MPRTIRLSKCAVGEEEKLAVCQVLDEEFLGMGKQVGQFERELGEFFGREVVCVVNGTAALHLALDGCNLPPRSEVLVPSLTYLASYQAIVAAGMTPVSCDVDATNLSLDILDATKRLTDKTKVIMPVHFSGSALGLSEVYNFAMANGLRVVEDAAHAFGSEHCGEKIGSFGDISCFSFDGIKNITSGEGGCVVAHDEKVLNRVRDSRLLGVIGDSERRLRGERSWEFDVKGPGWRYHMSNLMAAIGLAQLGKREKLAEKRKNLASLYDIHFTESKLPIYPVARSDPDAVPHIYVVRVANLKDRAKLRQDLLERGIETGVNYYPNHLLSLFGGGRTRLPVTERIFPELLSLPLHPDLTEEDVAYVFSELVRCV